MDSSALTQSKDMEAAVATLAAMRYQEDTGYNKKLHLIKPTVAEARKKMVAWSYQVVDFCKFSRESVDVSSSYLDRYLQTPAGQRALHNRTVFQLAAMASLYTAVKIHEPEAMDPKLVSSLSRNTYTSEDVERMERELCQAISWRMNPPTALSFVRLFFHLIPSEAMDEETRMMAYDIAKFQTELAVSEFNFCNVQSSVTAYCSLMNALDSMDIDTKISQYISMILRESISLCVDEEVLDVQSYLYSAVTSHRPKKVAPASPKYVGSSITSLRPSVIQQQ